MFQYISGMILIDILVDSFWPVKSFSIQLLSLFDVTPVVFGKNSSFQVLML